MPGQAVVDPEIFGQQPTPLKSLPPAAIRAALARCPFSPVLAARMVTSPRVIENSFGPPSGEVSDSPQRVRQSPARRTALPTSSESVPLDAAPLDAAPPGGRSQAPTSAAPGQRPVAPTTPPPATPAVDHVTPPFRLARGDIVVFTGQMRVPREIWENRAVAAGLVPYPGVTPRARLVVAADPAALSGKARIALELGIPVITEEEFGRLVSQRRS